MEKDTNHDTLQSTPPETTPTQQNIETTQAHTNLKLLAPVLIIALVLSTSVIAYLGYQNYQIKKQIIQIQPITSPTSTPPEESISPTPKTESPSHSTKVDIKKINYSVPTGWTTITDSTNSFQLSYDATKLRTCYPDKKGISLCAQYGSYFSASILPYDGGSRHKFIYSNGLGTPTKDELWPDYHEHEYDFDGKSCLFLDGINISQYPPVWGMCAIDNTRAVLFTSHDRAGSAHEIHFQSFKLIK